ncbi:MAG: 50S ribosomal protein L21 [Candidatus Kryptoniota bacterium]
MLAVVEIAGKQYKVNEGTSLAVPHLKGEPDEKVKFDKVLYLETETDKFVGSPTVPGASVSAVIVKHDREPKILVFKKKRRKNFKVTKGHRQQYTTIYIDKISK